MLGAKTFRIVGVYVPDSSYSDDDVEFVYLQLEEYIREARSKRYCCRVAGDFNAQVGQKEEFDDSAAIGSYCFRDRNARGRWLVEWCGAQGLILANTFFDADVGNAWTYRNGTSYRQLDYIIADTYLFSRISGCSVYTQVDIGSDHRAVLVEFAYPKCRAQACSKAKRPSSKWSVNIIKYKDELGTSLSKHRASQPQLESNEHVIQKVDLQAEEHARVDGPSAVSDVSSEDRQIKTLILERRRIQQDPTVDSSEKDRQRKDICKQLQKLIRRRARSKKTVQIQKILSEFRGLSEIAAIKQKSVKKKGIASMKDGQGNVKTEMKDIADVFAVFYEDLYKSRFPSPEQQSCE